MSETTFVEMLNENELALARKSLAEPKWKKTLITAAVLLVLIAGGCLYFARAYLFITGNPDNLINSYYQYIRNEDYGSAYDLLAGANQNMYSKDDFTLYFSLNRSYTQYKDYQIAKVNEYKNMVLDNSKFPRVIEYNVTENLTMDSDSNNPKNALYKVYIVADSGHWRIYRLKEDMKLSISNEYCSIGYMYQTGKGRDKDVTLAEESFNNAVSYDKDNPVPYFNLGMLYYQTNKIDNAITIFQEYMAKDIDKQEESDACNMLAFCFVGKHDKKTALGYFEKALELNPENKNIKQWMTYAE